MAVAKCSARRKEERLGVVTRQEQKQNSLKDALSLH